MNISFLFSLFWGCVVALLLTQLAPALTGLFVDDRAVTDIADTYLYMVPVSYGAWGVLMMSSAIFNALGKPVRSTIMSVTRMFVVYVPLAVALEILYGYKGIFMAACVSNVLMGITAYIWNRRSWRPDID